ncbi:MAG: glycoside hydrolase family 3, partial [Propionibacteriaceae bacterium]|nr:glycoside hydrolase family 3 [Propionibacteriaceae bacterium]
APSADTVPPGEAAANAPIGQLERNFATDPAVVGASAAAFIAGLSQAGVMTAVKHFPGLGRVAGNTDFTADGIVDDRTTADDLYLGAFATALAARPAMVMVSLARYSQLDPDHPAALSPAIVTDLLRGRLGWDSVVVSDSLSAQAVASLSAGQRAVDFIRAGGDLTIFQVAAEAQEAWQALVDTAAADPAFAAQLEASVQRLLTAKAAAGLLSA